MSNYSQSLIKLSNQISGDSLLFLDKTINTYLKSFDKKENFKYCYDRYLSYLDNSKKLPFSKSEFNKAFGSKTFFKDFFDCGSWLEFRYYKNQNDTKLHHGNFCKKDKLCPACAVRRAYKQQQKFITIYDNIQDLQDKDWYYIVLPVRHSKDDHFEIVFKRLNDLKSKITKSIRDKTMNNFFSQFAGGMFSIETTKTKNGWNVHINLLINAPKGSKINLKAIKNKKGQVSYQNAELALFMQKYGDNSLMHNIQKLNFTNIDELKNALLEIVKYSLKFSSLSNSELLEFFVKTYKKRLFGTFGNLWGLGLDDVELEQDDVIDTEWLEIIFTRFANEYRLKSINEVKNEK